MGDLLAKLRKLGGANRCRRRATFLLGAFLGLSQAAARSREGWAVQGRALQPFPASLPIDAKGKFPCAKETPNPFLPHLIAPGALSPIPQPSPASKSGDVPVPITKPPAALYTVMGALPEIFPSTALAHRA